MDALEAIMTTRAMRRFTSEPVTDAELEACLAAAQQAPSGGNIQPWQFVVVRDADVRASVAAVYLKSYERYRKALLAALPPFRTPDDEATFHRGEKASHDLARSLGDVPVLVAFCIPTFDLTLNDEAGPLDIGTPFASVYPAVQNLMVAARAQGLGTVMTTVYRIHQAELREVLGIPERYEIVALVPLGRPSGRFGVAPRRPWTDVTHWDGWKRQRS